LGFHPQQERQEERERERERERECSDANEQMSPPLLAQALGLYL
jgi:hypothetical protein